MPKLCSRCSRPAQFSLVFVVSSVGISPRRQGCSAAVLFCDDCLRELCESDRLCTDTFKKAVNRALTALNQRSRARGQDADCAGKSIS